MLMKQYYLCFALIALSILAINCSGPGFSSLDTIPPEELNARGTIYFSRSTGDQISYWAIEANGTNLHTVDSLPQQEFWNTSPNGQYHAQVVQNYPHDLIYIYDNDHSVISSTDEFEPAGNFQWSEDNSKVYFYGREVNSNRSTIASLDLHSSIHCLITVNQEQIGEYGSLVIKISRNRLALMHKYQEYSYSDDSTLYLRQADLNQITDTVDIGTLPLLWQRDGLGISDEHLGPYATDSSWVVGIYYDRWSDPILWFGEIDFSGHIIKENQSAEESFGGYSCETSADGRYLFWIKDIYGDSNSFCWIDIHNIERFNCVNTSRRITDYSLSPYENRLAFLGLDGLFVFDFSLNKFAQLLSYSFDSKSEISWQ